MASEHVDEMEQKSAFITALWGLYEQEDVDEASKFARATVLLISEVCYGGVHGPSGTQPRILPRALEDQVSQNTGSHDGDALSRGSSPASAALSVRKMSTAEIEKEMATLSKGLATSKPSPRNRNRQHDDTAAGEQSYDKHAKQGQTAKKDNHNTSRSGLEKGAIGSREVKKGVSKEVKKGSKGGFSVVIPSKSK